MLEMFYGTEDLKTPPLHMDHAQVNYFFSFAFSVRGLWQDISFKREFHHDKNTKEFNLIIRIKISYLWFFTNIYFYLQNSNFPAIYLCLLVNELNNDYCFTDQVLLINANKLSRNLVDERNITFINCFTI